MWITFWFGVVCLILCVYAVYDFYQIGLNIQTREEPDSFSLLPVLQSYFTHTQGRLCSILATPSRVN